MSNRWNELMAAAVEIRREFHRKPELTWAEHETARRIRNELTRLDIPWRVCAETGTIGVLAAKAAGRHIALRTDIDALPIMEATGAAWASEIPGRMHACGHDGHTATLLAVAEWMKRHEAELPGPVSLFFQPAEEGGHGAQKMIEDGALESIDAVFGWHNWPSIPFGEAVCPDGPVMAANATFRITVQGKGGHSSQPELCRDPVLGAAAITMAMQQIVSRRLEPQQAAVVSVTSIDANSGETIIPAEVTMAGSLRVAEDRYRDRVMDLVVKTAEETARAYGVTAEVNMHPRYRATVNDPAEAARYREVLKAELGESWRSESTPVPIMASEDFSYYLKERPGAFALIGADDGNGHDAVCHSPLYDFNDRLIAVVSRLYLRLAGAPLPSRVD
jgi:hippurate hydrolase